MITEKQKMLAGDLYVPNDPELLKEREVARIKTHEYNRTTDVEKTRRVQLLKDLLGSTGENVYMEPNIRVDYGYNIHVGDNFFCEFRLYNPRCL